MINGLVMIREGNGETGGNYTVLRPVLFLCVKKDSRENPAAFLYIRRINQMRKSVTNYLYSIPKILLTCFLY